jgi:hypothetical protein
MVQTSRHDFRREDEWRQDEAVLGVMGSLQRPGCVDPRRRSSMRPNAHLSGSAAVRSGRRPVLVGAILIVAAAVSTGCADDVVMQNPRTGISEICHESLRGLDPWSQTMACVASHEAQGWIRVGQQ